MKEELTQDELKKRLKYDSMTGDFVYKTSPVGTVKKGSKAGVIHHTGYRYIKMYGERYPAHHLAWLYMTGEWPKHEIDHVDGKKDNNAFNNLRDVTKGENLKNKRLYRNNISGIPGVSWHKQHKKWYAGINLNKKAKFLGLYDDFFEACCSRKAAENRYGFHENHGKVAL